MISRILEEDQTMLYNKWVSGIASRDLKGQAVTLDDIVSKYNNDVNGDKARPELPYPLTLFTDLIGEVYIKMRDMQEKINVANTYPIVKENENGKIALIRINKKAEEIKKILIAMTDDLGLITKGYGAPKGLTTEKPKIKSKNKQKFKNKS